MNAHDERFLGKDLDGSDPDITVRVMREQFSYHPLAVNDVLQKRHPPKFGFFGDVMFLLLPRLDAIIEELADTPAPHVFAAISREIRDIPQQLQRSVTLSDRFIDLAGDQVDASLATASHRLSQTLRVLTIITVIFVPPPFLAGIYGMNSENMPPLRIAGVYCVVLTVMTASVVLQLWLFSVARSGFDRHEPGASTSCRKGAPRHE